LPVPAALFATLTLVNCTLLALAFKIKMLNKMERIDLYIPDILGYKNLVWLAGFAHPAG
jgi:hypothetical protein